MTQMPLGGMAYRLPTVLQADPYGPNPLVTNLSVTNMGMFVAASERAAAPTLFATGDLPLFTSSGLEPDLLTRLPYHWRHFAASVPDRGQVLSMIEEAAQDPAAAAAGTFAAPGLDDYRMRMERWVAGLAYSDELGEGVQAYPEAWSRGDRLRREQTELAQEQKRSQADYARRMGQVREEREAVERHRFLFGDHDPMAGNRNLDQD